MRKFLGWDNYVVRASGRALNFAKFWSRKLFLGATVCLLTNWSRYTVLHARVVWEVRVIFHIRGIIRFVAMKLWSWFLLFLVASLTPWKVGRPSILYLCLGIINGGFFGDLEICMVFNRLHDISTVLQMGDRGRSHLWIRFRSLQTFKCTVRLLARVTLKIRFSNGWFGCVIILILFFTSRRDSVKGWGFTGTSS